jgi:hypothetical protein
MSNVLTGKPADAEDVELSPEEQALEEKKARIKFHRENVRNGPVKFNHITAGQERRAKARAQKRAIKKNFKRDVRNHFERQRVAATLRPHLQNVGLLPFYDRHEAPLQDQIVSTGWICQRYGKDLGNGHVSFERSAVIEALGTAAMFYNSATGTELRVGANFEPAIYSIAGDEVA